MKKAGSSKTSGEAGSKAGSPKSFSQGGPKAGSSKTSGQVGSKAGSLKTFGQAGPKAGSFKTSGQAGPKAGSIKTSGQAGAKAGSPKTSGQAGHKHNNSKLSLTTVMNDVAPFLGDQINKRKTVHQKMSLKDFTQTSANILLSHYKIVDQDILHTTALAMSDLDSSMADSNFKEKFGRIESSLQSLQPYQQLFLEKNVQNMLSKDNVRALFGHIEELDMPANASLQTLLLVSAMSLTGNKPAGLKQAIKLPSNKSSGLNRMEVKKRMNLIITLSEILYQKSITFKNLEATKFKKMHKDLVHIASKV